MYSFKAAVQTQSYQTTFTPAGFRFTDSTWTFVHWQWTFSKYFTVWHNLNVAVSSVKVLGLLASKQQVTNFLLLNLIKVSNDITSFIKKKVQLVEYCLKWDLEVTCKKICILNCVTLADTERGCYFPTHEIDNKRDK